jgi:predicted GNAT family acetyltransferase
LRGTGAAGTFMKNLMEKLRGENVKVVPVCPYSVSWLRKHAEYADLISV